MKIGEVSRGNTQGRADSLIAEGTPREFTFAVEPYLTDKRVAAQNQKGNTVLHNHIKFIGNSEVWCQTLSVYLKHSNLKGRAYPEYQSLFKQTLLVNNGQFAKIFIIQDQSNPLKKLIFRQYSCLSSLRILMENPA